jgi:large-conductance mechanosensitive channel
LSAGIFLGAIFLSLVDEARKEDATSVFIIGFAVGAIVFSISNHYFKKRSEKQSLDESANSRTKENIGSASTVIVGTFLDSILETLFIGIIIGLHLPDLIPSVIALAFGNLTATEQKECMKKVKISLKYLEMDLCFYSCCDEWPNRLLFSRTT